MERVWPINIADTALGTSARPASWRSGGGTVDAEAAPLRHGVFTQCLPERPSVHVGEDRDRSVGITCPHRASASSALSTQQLIALKSTSQRGRCQSGHVARFHLPDSPSRSQTTAGRLPAQVRSSTRGYRSRSKPNCHAPPPPMVSGKSAISDGMAFRNDCFACVGLAVFTAHLRLAPLRPLNFLETQGAPTFIETQLINAELQELADGVTYCERDGDRGGYSSPWGLNGARRAKALPFSGR